MANFENVASEKSGFFEDAAYDPDLEARLYAEIYYSNENYQQEPNFADANSPSLETSSAPPEEVNSETADRENILRESNDNNDNPGKAPEKFVGSPSFYASRTWVLGESAQNDSRSDSRKRIVAQKYLKPPRLLAHKGLWLPRVDSESQRRNVPAQRERNEDSQVVDRSDEHFNNSGAIADGNIDSNNILPIAAGSKEAGNVSDRLRSQTREVENIRPIASSSREAENPSEQLVTQEAGSETIRQVENSCNAAGNVFGRFASRWNRPEDFGSIARGPEEADDVFVNSDEARHDLTRLRRSLTIFSEDAEITDDIVRRNYCRLREDSPGGRKIPWKQKRKELRIIKRQKQQQQQEQQRTARRKEPSKSRKLEKGVKDALVTMESSKYKVVSKKNKLRMKEIEPEHVEIISDSDDSILEVPVPPKAPPLIIHLQDSDDDCGEAREVRSKKVGKLRPCESSSNDKTDSSENNAPSCGSSSGEIDATNSPRVSREAVRKQPRNADISGATTSLELRSDCEDDAGKASKSRSRRGKKSADEPREESTTIQADSSKDDESLEKIMGEANSTNSQRTQKETGKKAKSVDSLVSSTQPDCEDFAGKSSKPRSKRGKKSAEVSADSSFKEDESSAAPISETVSTSSQKIAKEAMEKPINSEASAAISIPIDGNLILNCTELQKGASSLEEIRKMRETAAPNHALSDDSMTESEANNWVNIAAGQANSSRIDDEICGIDSSSIDQTLVSDPALCEGKDADNSAKENPAVSGDANLPSQTADKIVEANSSSSVTSAEINSSRKRLKETASSTFNDFDVPAVPEKRAKQSKPKTSKEQSMTEYFFKPMSKEMQTFYNYPWGGENLDMCDIQSRMPRNPNCWAILDADLQGPASKRRRLCPRCKTDSHFGKKCPEKAKAPCCYMCGEKGHTESRCPHTMCLTCGRKYATYRPTCGFCSQLYCTMCHAAGHSRDDCPDLWRRYHNTTTETTPIMPRDGSSMMKPMQNLSCCNCARRGHDETMCRQLRWSQHFPTSMCISSYTEGPMYEPSASDRGREAGFMSNFTEDVWVNEEVCDVDSSSVGNRESRSWESREERESRELNPGNIELIEIPDDSHSSDPPFPRRLIFRAGEWDEEKMRRWQSSTKRLDTMEKIELTGLLNGNTMPAFLNVWRTVFEFSVEVTQENGGAVFLNVRSPVSAILKQLEKIMWQWLSRTDAEKAYLDYGKIPYENTKALKAELQTKRGVTNSVLQPLALLKKIAMYDKSLEQTVAKLKQTLTKKNRRRLKALKNTADYSMIRRWQLVMSLYYGSWVENADATLQTFFHLARERLKLLKSGKTPPIRDYLRLVYSYNEIFTFYENEKLRKALKKAVAAALQTEPPKQIPPSEILAYPPAEFPGAEFFGSGNSPKALNRLITAVKPISEENPGDSPEESLQILPNSNSEPQPPPLIEPQIFNESRSQINDRAPAINDRAPAINARAPVIREENPPATKSGKQNKGFLKNASKKSRKLFMRSAKGAIKIANSSNDPRLQEMAKVLTKKIKRATVQKNDVEMLQQAISDNLRSRKDVAGLSWRETANLREFRGTRKLQPDRACNNDPSYSNFLETL